MPDNAALSPLADRPSPPELLIDPVKLRDAQEIVNKALVSSTLSRSVTVQA